MTEQTVTYPRYSKGRHHRPGGTYRTVSDVRSDLSLYLLTRGADSANWPTYGEFTDTVLRTLLSRQDITDLMT